MNIPVARPATRAVKPIDDATFAKCLRLHRRLHPLFALIDRAEWIVYLAMLAPVLPIFFADRYPISLLPYAGLLAVFPLGVHFLCVGAMWQDNIETLAKSNNVAAVAALLDYAATSFLGGKPSEKLIGTDKIVLRYLPDLLARMPAGDGPTLTPDQRAALARLLYNERYDHELNLPGLREKIEAMLEK